MSDKMTPATPQQQGGARINHFTQPDMSPAKSVTTETAGGMQVSEMPKTTTGSMSSAASHNIVTIAMPKTHVVTGFVPGKLKDKKGTHYSDMHGAFGSEVERKNARFRIHELTRGPLSVEAEEEARILAEVQARVDNELGVLREKAHKDAYAAGFDMGKTDAIAEVLLSAKPAIEKFEKLIGEIEGLKFELAKANEDLITRLIYRLARMVALKEVKEDADYTRRLILQLLERIGTRENIKIYVGMEAYTAADSLKDGLMQALGTLKNVNIELDPEIEDKGCRIETDFGEVDATIDVQLKNIEATFA